eukprot:jgi/Mesvir1/3270/Mv16404-RA.2
MACLALSVQPIRGKDILIRTREDFQFATALEVARGFSDRMQKEREAAALLQASGTLTPSAIDEHGLLSFTAGQVLVAADVLYRVLYRLVHGVYVLAILGTSERSNVFEGIDVINQATIALRALCRGTDVTPEKLLKKDAEFYRAMEAVFRSGGGACLAALPSDLRGYMDMQMSLAGGAGLLGATGMPPTATDGDVDRSLLAGQIKASPLAPDAHAAYHTIKGSSGGGSAGAPGGRGALLRALNSVAFAVAPRGAKGGAAAGDGTNPAGSSMRSSRDGGLPPLGGGLKTPDGAASTSFAAEGGGDPFGGQVSRSRNNSFRATPVSASLDGSLDLFATPAVHSEDDASKGVGAGSALHELFAPLGAGKEGEAVAGFGDDPFAVSSKGAALPPARWPAEGDDLAKPRADGGGGAAGAAPASWTNISGDSQWGKGGVDDLFGAAEPGKGGVTADGRGGADAGGAWDPFGSSKEEPFGTPLTAEVQGGGVGRSGASQRRDVGGAGESLPMDQDFFALDTSGGGAEAGGTGGVPQILRSSFSPSPEDIRNIAAAARGALPPAAKRPLGDSDELAAGGVIVWVEESVLAQFSGSRLVRAGILGKVKLQYPIGVVSDGSEKIRFRMSGLRALEDRTLLMNRAVVSLEGVKGDFSVDWNRTRPEAAGWAVSAPPSARNSVSSSSAPPLLRQVCLLQYRLRPPTCPVPLGLRLLTKKVDGGSALLLECAASPKLEVDLADVALVMRLPPSSQVISLKASPRYGRPFVGIPFAHTCMGSYFFSG